MLAAKRWSLSIDYLIPSSRAASRIRDSVTVKLHYSRRRGYTPLIQYNPTRVLTESSNGDEPANEIDPSRALRGRTSNFAARVVSDRIYTLRRQGLLRGLDDSKTLM